tara:strand:- start:18132 stop:19265 length:1134 start_codon:yes stop_codon:yes gene_type:complete
MKKDYSELNQDNFEDNSIQIIFILKKIWANRNLLKKLIFVFFIIGVFVAITSPVLFVSHTTFVPQTSDNNSNTNKGYAELASLAGINLNAEVGSSLDNYISPLLYSKIINSEEFSLSLIKEEIVDMDGNRLTVKDYIIENSKGFNVFGIIGKILDFFKKYTIGFILKSDSNVNNLESDEKYNFIDEDDYKIIKVFKKKFSIELNEKEGYIKVLANDKSPLISTQLVYLVTKTLQSKIISLRTNKIKEELEYSEVELSRQKEKFEALQNELASFKDSNKNISTAIFASELQKLQSEYNLQQNILISLSSEFNKNKIKLNKDTPIFSVLDEVTIPNEKSKPRRMIIVLAYSFIGFMISIIYILSNERIREIINFIKKTN